MRKAPVGLDLGSGSGETLNTHSTRRWLQHIHPLRHFFKRNDIIYLCYSSFPLGIFLIVLLIVCVFRPGSFSWQQVVRMSPVERLEHAFTVAKDQLAIERLLDPEGTVALQAISNNKQRCLTFY